MATVKTMPAPKENQEQQALFTWAAWQSGNYPDLELMYAIPNGEFRHITTGKILKITGVKPGVPDICLPVARGQYHGLYIEMKRIKGSKVSDDQQRWITALSAQGYRATVCKGWEEASREIVWYLGLGAGKAPETAKQETQK